MSEGVLYNPSPIQVQFHTCQANEILFGGSAGPGKSMALLMDPIQTQLASEHKRWRDGGCTRPSIGWAIHFRREFPRLEQTIERSQRMFRAVDPGAHWDGTKHLWTFSCGYRFQFGHMKYEDDKFSYMSNEYCVAKGTPVLMGDGTWRPIDAIEEGQAVMTLEGPKRVTKTHRPGVKPCVLARVFGEDGLEIARQVHPENHPILTSDGVLCEGSPPRRYASQTGFSKPRTDRDAGWQTYKSLLEESRSRQGRFASPAGGESAAAALNEIPRASGQPVALTCLAALYAPTLRQVVSGSAHESLGRALSYARTLTPALRDSRDDCRDGRRSCGGLPRDRSDSDQSSLRLPADAAGHTPVHCTSDAPVPSRTHSRFAGPGRYFHRYTKEARPADLDLAFYPCELTPCGDVEVCDLTVEDANHYITNTGIVNTNSHIAWDELPEFSQGQYEFVNTRLRSSDRELQKRLRIVAAANPAGNWVRERFVDPCKDGNTLLVTSIRLSDGTVVKRSRIYIPAKLKDNPDVEFRRRYEEELRDKPAHIRLALLESDWYSVAGAFFAEEFDPAVHVCQPFRIPSGWFRFRALDWGYKSPGSVGYYAVDRDGNLIKYRELTFQRKTVDQVAEMMQQVEDAAGEWDHGRRCSRLNGPADNQIWEKRGTIGPTIQETFAQYGIFWKKATKNRRAATAELIERLRQRGENQVPGIRFFNTCKNTIRTLPSRMTDPTDPEVPEDGGEDHWLDETFYACMSRPVVPKHDHLPHSREWYDDFEKSAAMRAPRNPRGGWQTGYGN